MTIFLNVCHDNAEALNNKRMQLVLLLDDPDQLKAFRGNLCTFS